MRKYQNNGKSKIIRQKRKSLIETFAAFNE